MKLWCYIREAAFFVRVLVIYKGSCIFFSPLGGLP